jgi:hypothetical protein
LNHLVRAKARAPDLRQCSALPELAPDTRPESKTPAGKGPAQPHSVITAATPLP